MFFRYKVTSKNPIIGTRAAKMMTAHDTARARLSEVGPAEDMLLNNYLTSHSNTPVELSSGRSISIRIAEVVTGSKLTVQAVPRLVG